MRLDALPLRIALFLSIVPLVGVGACADDTSTKDPGAAHPAPYATGKADAADLVELQGTLGYGDEAAMAGVFDRDLVYFGYEIEAREGAVVTLEVSQKGSTRKLDTTMYLFGPFDEEGDQGFGDEAFAFDDDSGWGLLSRLKKLELPAAGRYLMVVGTYDGRGRGKFRVRALCHSGECAPEAPAPDPEPGACHQDIFNAIAACMRDAMMDLDYEYRTNVYDLVAQCADLEVVAPTWDALCAGVEPTGMCASLEAFDQGYLPACRAAVYHASLDETCALGEVYGDLFGRAEAMVPLWRKQLTAGDALTALEKAQILEAIKTTAYDEVTTVAEAFEAVDDQIINQAEVWDASARRGFTVYEVGAGDNSFGAVFELGTTTVAAHIIDGDFSGCTPRWGDERRRCLSDDDCRGATRCIGKAGEGLIGRCVDPDLDDHPAITSHCDDLTPCPAGSGLVCGAEMCWPAWMQGHFPAGQDITPIADDATTEIQLLAFGLATVDVEVHLDFDLAHEDPSQVSITLTNPGGTTVEIIASGQVLGFSGDEGVNGLWTVSVMDAAEGQTGVLYDLGLTVTSRWD